MTISKCRQIFRRIFARVNAAIDGQNFKSPQKKVGNRIGVKRGFGEKRNAARQADKHQCRVNQAVWVIENKDNRAVFGNSFDADGFDSPKEKPERNADKGVNKLARECAFAKENHLPQAQNFYAFRLLDGFILFVGDFQFEFISTD